MKTFFVNSRVHDYVKTHLRISLSFTQPIRVSQIALSRRKCVRQKNDVTETPLFLTNETHRVPVGPPWGYPQVRPLYVQHHIAILVVNP